MTCPKCTGVAEEVTCHDDGAQKYVCTKGCGFVWYESLYIHWSELEDEDE